MFTAVRVLRVVALTVPLMLCAAAAAPVPVLAPVRPLPDMSVGAGHLPAALVPLAAPVAAAGGGRLPAAPVGAAAFPLPGPHSAGLDARRVARSAALARVPAWRAQAGDAASLLVVVNKQRPLDPVTYAPADLRPADGVLLRTEAADAFERLSAAAEAAGAPVEARSGFRSYADQVRTHRRWVRTLGSASAEAQSARPGFSEHQTGLAVDVLPRGGACQDFGCFGATPQAAWLAKNAGRFGFVVRYQAGQQAVTGYTDEPWHLRYVGVRAAADVAASGARSLEEHIGLPAAPTY
ncbi:M15 family metallopeptidase [Xylanimonas sp. McL0601]|uniref:M15 family metallopeptidase n=1 Tax=Xylanimonas sp. McL0601 TaxID=3414739 RepID=UPI003CEC4F44